MAGPACCVFRAHDRVRWKEPNDVNGAARPSEHCSKQSSDSSMPPIKINRVPCSNRKRWLGIFFSVWASFYSWLGALTQFPTQLWYASLHIFLAPIGSVDLSAESRHWTYFSRHRVWQSKPCASACQKRPKLREIRIAPVIFLFIDFFSFGKTLESRFTL